MTTILTDNDFAALEKRYGLTPVKVAVQTLPVRDGVVEYGKTVWWRCEEGPQKVIADGKQGHWENIKHCPRRYQLAQPKMKSVYAEE